LTRIAKIKRCTLIKKRLVLMKGREILSNLSKYDGSRYEYEGIFIPISNL
jgi:hypothetical protein